MVWDSFSRVTVFLERLFEVRAVRSPRVCDATDAANSGIANSDANSGANCDAPFQPRDPTL
jgi:hypothetical protein